MNWGSKLKKHILPVVRLCVLLLFAFFLPRFFLKKPASHSEKRMVFVAQQQESEKTKNEKKWRENGRLLAELHQLS